MIQNPLISVKDLESNKHYTQISRNTIDSMRLLGGQLIHSGVRMLKMSHACNCTAQVLFQQFYALESFLEYPLIEIVMASVFVAGKVEECIRRARDVVNVFHHLYCLIRSLPAHPIDYVGDTYYVWRDRLCTSEAVLLRKLGFHVQPASPVPMLISYLKVLELDLLPEFPQLAFSLLNDCLRTQASVLFQPNVLAVCAIDLAAERSGFSFPAKESLIADWFALFDVNEVELRGCREAVKPFFTAELDLLLPLSKEELKIFNEQFEEEEEEKSGISDFSRSDVSLRNERSDRNDRNGRKDYSHSRNQSHQSYSSNSKNRSRSPPTQHSRSRSSFY